MLLDDGEFGLLDRGGVRWFVEAPSSPKGPVAKAPAGAAAGGAGYLAKAWPKGKTPSPFAKKPKDPKA